MDLSNTVALSTTQGFFFRGYAGVYIPAGAQRSSTGAAGSWTTIGAGGETLTGTRYVAMPYFPATYWKAETCTAQAITNINATCVLHADGVTTLKRYEIRAANYSSTAAYNAALQNFANWWSYYRKRKLMLAGSMGTAMENLSGVRMGVASFTLGQTEYNKASPAATTMYDADATAAASNRLRVAGFFYTNPGNGSTWTAETLKYIGDQYTSKNTATVQYACQRNNAFIVTDGFANANPVTPPAYTTRSDTNAAPYTPIQANMLADIATSYFSNNLRPELATGKVPLGKQDVANKDSNTNLHMNTYAITLGAKGTVWPGITNPFAATFNWPTVSTSGQQESIDDLWHATINGRGQMYLASSPEGNGAEHPGRPQRHPQPDRRPGGHRGEHGEPVARRLARLLRHLQPGRLGRRPDQQCHRPGHRRGQHHAHLARRQPAGRARLEHPRHCHQGRRLHRRSGGLDRQP